MSIATDLAKLSRKNKEQICKEWYNQLLLTEDKEALVKMYLRGIDYCLSNDYPSTEFIRKNFGKIAEKYGVYVGAKIEVVNPSKLVLLDSCFGSCQVTNYNTSEVFLKHKSTLLIVAQGNAFVMVDLFDEAIVQVVAGEDSKVVINRYGGKVSDPQNFDNAVIKIVEKHKKTY